MFRIGQSTGELDIKLSDEMRGVSKPFYIDAARRIKFEICVTPEGFCLQSACKGIVCVKFYLWMKNTDTGETDPDADDDKTVLTQTFHFGENYGYDFDEGDLEKFVKDGVLTVGYRIEDVKASIPIKQEMTMCWPSSEFYDCVICVGDRKFSASKYILSMQSDVFAALWKADMVEGKTNELKIEDFDAATVENMLNYLHSFGYDFVDDENVDELYKIADKYQLFVLKGNCARTMMEKMSEKNFHKYLILAFEYSAEDLKQDAVKFACSDQCRKILANSPEFSKLGVENFELCMEILRALWA